MKKQNLLKKQKQNFRLGLLLAGLAAMLSTACTKSRDPELKGDELRSEIFAINTLDSKEFELTTESSVVTEAKSEKINVLDEKPSVKIAKTSAPSGLQKIFKGLIIKADAGDTLKMKLSLKLANSGSALHVLKVVTAESKLTEIEKQTQILVGTGKDQKKAVPLFKVSVVDFGQVCRVKDDNGDETSALQLCHTAPEDATHVQLALTKNDRSTYLASDSLEHTFLGSGLDNRVMTLETLKEKLDVAISPADATKVVSMVAPGSGSNVAIYVYKILKKSDITDDKLLKKLDSNVRLGEIGYCSKEVLAQLSAEEQKDCVVVLAYEIKAQAVTASVKTTDDMAQPTLSVVLKPADAKKSDLITIAPKSAVETILVGEISSLNPYNTIRVSDLKDKEFLLRRTFEDGAATIQVFGPGASGALDIVKFEFEDRRLVVRRATVVNGMADADRIDKEELMSIPVRYLGIDPNSNSVNPKLIDVNKDTAKYVLLNWTSDTLPTVNSPLAYFQDGMCFNGTGAQSVTDLDNRIQDGVLNFSISGSYSFSPDCMSFYGMQDYWYGSGLQGVFNIKERVSFKLHTRDLDKKAIELPFDAQNMMNFGVFTQGQLKPDDFGNARKIGTQLSNPVVHDFSGGKTLVYSLGGLPQDGWIREALISGTKEVIQEWNDGLKLAFKGTELEREGDYVVLKIDGIDQTPGRLGDLDRNYIWNFQKSLDSGLLGMSQAGPNPRSGRIEQNNVLMYSGNLLSNIGSVREMARLQKEYAEMKAKALAQANEGQQGEQQEETPATEQTDENGGLIIENGRRLQGVKPQVRQAIQSAAQKLIRHLNEKALFERPQTPVLSAKSASNKVKQNATQATTRMKADLGLRFTDLTKNSNSARMLESAYLTRIFKKAIEMGATRDELTLNALSSAEVLKSYGDRLSIEQKNVLAAQSRRLALMAEFNKNFQKGPNCAIVAGARGFAGADIDPEILDDSKLPETFKSWYKSTLLHEVGHSLGLTHNFMGSTDKSNFTFKNDAAASKDRNYSSIMDYIPDHFMKYHGPGVYDVRALRAAYTGRVELHPGLKAFLSKDGKKVVFPQGQVEIAVQPLGTNPQFDLEVKIEDLRKALLGEKSLWELDARAMSRLPLKPYAYCTDVHVGGDPACNRWDLGTNNLEIAKFYIDEYQKLYPVLNQKGQRMAIRDVGSYIGRLFYEFIGIRGMLDETFYLAISGYPQQVWLPSALGALEGLKLFATNVVSPNVSLPFASQERFQTHDIPVFDEQGNPVANPDGSPKTEKIVVESKANQDLGVPGKPYMIDTRGVELDKAISLMMLTQRGMGNPRYEAMSLRVSFAEFEKYLLGAEAQNSLTLGMVKGILADNPTAMTLTDSGGLVPLPATFKTDVSELVRYYAGLSAGILMDADTLEDKYNFSALFRVGGSQKSAPRDRFMVTKLDQSLTSPTSLKLWAMDNASIAGDLVRSTAQKRSLIDRSAKMIAPLNKLFKALKAQDEATAKTARAELLKQLQAANQNGLLLNKEEATQISFDQVVDFMLGFMVQNDQLAEQVLKLVLEGQIPAELVPLILQSTAQEIEALSKSLPYAGLASKALLLVYAEEKAAPGTAGAGQQAGQAPAAGAEQDAGAEPGAATGQAPAAGPSKEEQQQKEMEKLKGQIFAMYLNDQVLESNHGMVVNNLGFLNKILMFTHEELNKFQ